MDSNKLSYCNGLKQKWHGTVWMNPPYGKFTENWLDKFIKHNNGIALVFSRTDTKWFQNYVKKSDAVLFASTFVTKSLNTALN